MRSVFPSLRVGQARWMGGAAAQTGNIKDFLLADIGEGIAEVEVLEWSVKVGTYVEEFEELLKVQSDKAATEITSPFEGTVVELMVNAGDMAQVGEPLCRIRVDGEEGVEESTSSAAPESVSSALPSAPSTTDRAASVDHDFKTGKVLTSPAVRRIARENDIDLRKVPGTGPKGRVLKDDVLAYMEGKVVQASPSATAGSTKTSNTSTPSSAVKHTEVATPIEIPDRFAEDQVVPVRGLDRIMVKTMAAAHTVPTLLYSDEFMMDQLIQVRTELKPMAEAMGVKLTYLPFIVKAASMALLEYPKLNCHVNNDCTEYTLKGSHNIGVALQTDKGLLVPNVKNVQHKSILQIAGDLSELLSLGHAGSLTSEHLSGGTFTISNIGSIGGTICKPLVVVPEVAIAALGKFQAVPKFDSDDELYKATVMNVSISADHRIIDGATVARFSNLWRRYLDSPSTMLLRTK